MKASHVRLTSTDDYEETNGHKETNLFTFIVDELGGTIFAMEAVDKSFDILDHFIPNKFVHKITNIGRSVLPFVLTTHRIVTSWIKWQKSQKQDTTDKKMYAIAKLLCIPKDKCEEYCDFFDGESIDLGSDVLSWLQSRPKTKNLKVLSITDIHGNDQNSATNVVPTGTALYIVIDWIGKKLVIEVLYNNNTMVMNTNIYYDYKLVSFSEQQEFRIAVFEAFAQCFDTKNNVLYYNSWGIITRPRGKSSFKIKQINYQQLLDEIRAVIKAGIKRGYGIGGPPGTGKTSAVMELENDLRDIPFVYINATVFRDADIDGVGRIFRFIRTIAPCVAVLEDIDTFDLGNKNMKLGELLEEVDTIKNDKPVVYIATFNESDKVHYSLLGRPGRIDQVFLVDIPRSIDTVREVFINRMKYRDKDVHDCNQLENSTIDRIIKNRFSQADICEIVDKCILNNRSLDNKNVLWSIEQLEATKRAIVRCRVDNEEEDLEDYL